MAARKLKLGETARDEITGFTGVIIGETKWLHGCTRFCLQPRELNKETGKPLGALWFDELQVERVPKTKEKTTGDTGGPQPAPARRSDPSH